MRKVAIFVFDGVEVLDFAGPFEVFGVSFDADGNRLFEVCTVAEKPGAIRARNDLSVNPTYTFETLPQPDILLIPGGDTRALVDSETVIQWVQSHVEKVELLLSVCTGAMVLAKAGLLKGLSATTYHTAFDRLRALSPDTTVCPNHRWVDNGKIVTSAGVSAGIDMALHIVRRLHGAEQSERTARHMEYEHWSADFSPVMGT